MWFNYSLEHYAVLFMMAVIYGACFSAVWLFMLPISATVFHFLLMIDEIMRGALVKIRFRVFATASTIANTLYLWSNLKILQAIPKAPPAISPWKTANIKMSDRNQVAILVHGTWAGERYNWRRWCVIADKLSGLGFDVYKCMWHSPNSIVGRIHTGRELASVINDNPYFSANDSQIVLVGHSYGGQVAHYAAKVLGGASVISLGTPFVILSKNKDVEVRKIGAGYFLTICATWTLGAFVFYVALNVLTKNFAWYQDEITRFDFIFIIFAFSLSLVIKIFSLDEAGLKHSEEQLSHAEQNKNEPPTHAIFSQADEILVATQSFQIVGKLSAAEISSEPPAETTIKWEAGRFFLISWFALAGMYFFLIVSREWIPFSSSLVNTFENFNSSVQIIVYALWLGAIIALITLVGHWFGFATYWCQVAKRVFNWTPFVNALRYSRMAATCAVAGLVFPFLVTYQCRIERSPANGQRIRLSIPLTKAETLRSFLYPLRHVRMLESPEVVEAIVGALRKN